MMPIFVISFLSFLYGTTSFNLYISLPLAIYTLSLKNHATYLYARSYYECAYIFENMRAVPFFTMRALISRTSDAHFF